jgi:histidyl-tRNA synthetase
MSVEDDHARAALDLYVAAIGEPAVRHAALLARDLRLSGRSVEIGEGKLKRSMEIANKVGARYVLIIGDNEMAAQRYALKNMASGEQMSLTKAEIAAHLTTDN